jgi:hypothetical protein
MHPHFALADQRWFDGVAVPVIAKQLRKPRAQCRLRIMPARQPGVEHRLAEIGSPVFV